MVPASGAMLALGAALSAACFVRAFGITFLGRPRSTGRRGCKRDRHAVARGHVCWYLPRVFGRPAPGSRHRRDGAGRAKPDRRPDASAGLDRLAVDRADCESRSSYNGLLVFAFIAFSTILAVQVIHRFASDALRRGPLGTVGSRNLVRPRNTRPIASPSPSAAFSATCIRHARRSICRSQGIRVRHAFTSRCAM